jgi:hypothetical protein
MDDADIDKRTPAELREAARLGLQKAMKRTRRSERHRLARQALALARLAAQIDRKNIQRDATRGMPR